MRELTNDEVEAVSGAAWPGPFLQQIGNSMAEFPNSAPGTWQRAWDNLEDTLEGAKPPGGDRPRGYFSVGI